MRVTMSKKINGLLLAGSLFVMGAMTACDSSDYNKGASSTDTTNADRVATTDTTASKPVVKARKGRASIGMSNDKAANDATGKTMKMEKDKDGVYSKVEVMPAYPGGESALQQFVENNVSYPQNAMDNNAEGTVRVSFVVDEKGTVTKPVVQDMNNAGNGLSEEAVRVIKQMPKWTPGMVKGKPVKTRLELPITFKLSET
jgi:protein TonB